MIKKIESINCASYNNYTWVSDLDEFKQINIFYGHNGAGKTILSRIMRCFELKSYHEDYIDAVFSLTINDNKTINQDNIVNPEDLNIIVYNKDFVNENLNFLINGRSGGNIKSFSSAIIGRDNSKILKEIDELLRNLGKPKGETEQASGLYLEKENLRKNIEQLRGEVIKKENEHNDALKNKAKQIREILGLSQSKYTITHIQNDINNIKETELQKYILLPDLYNKYLNTIGDEAKNIISFETKIDTTTFNALANDCKNIIEVKLVAKEDIENNLRKWLNEGLKHHDCNKLESQECKFCGNKLTNERIKWLLDNLKDDKKDKLAQDISRKLDELREFYKIIKGIIEDIEKIQISNFYIEFKDNFETKKQEAIKVAKEILCEVKNIGTKMKEKEEDVYKDLVFQEPDDKSVNLVDILNEIKKIIYDNNQKTKNLQNEKQNASNKIKFNQIVTLLRDIKYYDSKKELEIKKQEMRKKESEEKQKILEIDQLINQINNKKASMSDEQAGADKINEYLKSYFGNNMLEFRAVEGNKSEFKIYRNDNEANNLSEGECSLAGFCYFMAKLQDADKNSIIWIDDPISSLDSNHIFFIFSLIDSELFDVKELKYHQLFISTHNLEFLKYIKRLRAISNGKANLYLIEKDENGSHIKDMPKFLKNYTTEFNYLFEQIYNQKDISNIEDEDIKTALIYNFGNNLRKFLEVYLFYKYPTVKPFSVEVIERFFKLDNDKSISSLVNRYANDLSHLREIMERGMKPLDISESKKIAKFVLETIKRKDPEQYEALCESIGKSGEL